MLFRPAHSLPSLYFQVYKYKIPAIILHLIYQQ